jgi:hypothetical protein
VLKQDFENVVAAQEKNKNLEREIDSIHAHELLKKFSFLIFLFYLLASSECQMLFKKSAETLEN